MSTNPSSQAPEPARQRPLGAHGERTRARLLDAARAVLRARGYTATRVDDITTEAGTSHGAFYLYFASKQDVLETLALETSDRMLALADRLESVGIGGHAREDLREWVEAFVAAYTEHAAVIDAWSESGRDSHFARLGEEVLRGFAARIARCIERNADGAIPADPGITAFALVAMLERFCHFWILAGARFPRDATLETLTSILHGTIFGDRPGTGPGESG